MFKKNIEVLTGSNPVHHLLELVGIEKLTDYTVAQFITTGSEKCDGVAIVTDGGDKEVLCWDFTAIS